MSNIEDDVKILKEFNSLKVNSPFRFVEISYPRLQKAISNILSDYTRQKQINEEHKKLNGELREKVKELEEIVNCCNIVKNETLSNDIVVMLKSDFIRNYEQIYIPKQVVKDIIDENGFEVYTREYGNVEVVSIDALQEFLETK